MGDAITDQVRQQYSAFRYPAPIMDLANYAATALANVFTKALT